MLARICVARTQACAIAAKGGETSFREGCPDSNNCNQSNIMFTPTHVPWKWMEPPVWYSDFMVIQQTMPSTFMGNVSPQVPPSLGSPQPSQPESDPHAAPSAPQGTTAGTTATGTALDDALWGRKRCRLIC